MHPPPKAEHFDKSAFDINTIWFGMRLTVYVGMGDERVATVTKIKNEPIPSFNWKDAKGRTGTASLSDIIV